MTGLIVDLFAGAGGASLGIEQAIGRSPDIAINHSHRAIAQHTANHPATRHYQTDIWEVDPAEATGGQPVELLWASPDCRHFSRAKGKAPCSPRVRSLAWVVVRWAAACAPRIICLENVPEFLGWGPLDDEGRPIPERAGETFREFCAQLLALGYEVEHRILCAADYGAATIRRRLFLVARRDGEPIAWPQPTHGAGLVPYRQALDIIDRSLPVPSIIHRKRPLAGATVDRVLAGCRRYVLAGHPTLIHLPTERGPQAAACWIAKHYGGVIGQPITAPLGTITSIDHHALCAAFLVSYYGSGGQWADLRDPLPTIVSKARHALVACTIAGHPYRIDDIGMRMLAPHELAAAQGFPTSYRLVGTKAEQIAGIGNSVCPDVARALIAAQMQPQGAVA